jgi:hypothetical protein
MFSNGQMDSGMYLEPLCTPRQAAQKLGGISASALYRDIKLGRVPFYRIGETGVRVRISEVLATLRRTAKGEEK